MPYSGVCGGENFVFADLKALLAAASPRRSGDELAGIGAPIRRRAGRGPLHPGRSAAEDFFEGGSRPL